MLVRHMRNTDVLCARAYPNLSAAHETSTRVAILDGSVGNVATVTVSAFKVSCVPQTLF